MEIEVSYRESSSSIRGVVEPLLGDDKILFNTKKEIDFHGMPLWITDSWMVELVVFLVLVH
jgi:hypothetical protein